MSLTNARAILLPMISPWADLANAQADLFVSICQQCVWSRPWDGGLSFSGERTGAQTGRTIQTKLVAELNTAGKGVKEANFQVERETQCPAVLVEVAFVSHEQERQLLTAYAGQLGAIAGGDCGICQWITIDKFTKCIYDKYKMKYCWNGQLLVTRVAIGRACHNPFQA